VDDNASTQVTRNNTFVITEYSKDVKIWLQQGLSINIFFRSTKDDSINQERFLNALAGPKESLSKSRKLLSVPTKRSEMGAGFLMSMK
jgi:hypothetical protein